MPNRRTILQSLGVVFSAGFAGCNVPGGTNGLDVEIQNEHSETHEVLVAIDDFEETVSLDPETSETFSDVLSYPDSDHSTEVKATVEIDEDWEDMYTFTVGEGLKAFIVNIGPEEEVSYTLKGR